MIATVDYSTHFTAHSLVIKGVLMRLLPQTSRRRLPIQKFHGHLLWRVLNRVDDSW